MGLFSGRGGASIGPWVRAAVVFHRGPQAPSVEGVPGSGSLEISGHRQQGEKQSQPTRLSFAVATPKRLLGL
eukprot:11173010-Lingulodinium_polyedra.AAC.1